MHSFSRILGSVLTIFIVLLALFVLGSFLPIKDHYTFRVVISGSMEPVIHTGSVVVTIPRKEYHVGDIVSFAGTAENPLPTTHRLVGESVQDGKVVFTTKGDANNHADYRTITKDEILGKEFLTIPYVGYFARFVGTSKGWTFFILLPVVFLFGWGFWDLIFSDRKKIAKNNMNKTVLADPRSVPPENESDEPTKKKPA
ncbi:MAG TPA: signal peptidase I [Candidatus Paceibacterota bacterium]|nr:signal peptidase I [Candidatus Paceibacterota bacterium]